MRKKTPSGPGSKRARAAAEAVEPIVELGEIENPALVVEQEEKAPSFKKAKCINSAKIPSPVKSIQNVEDDMTSLPRTPSPVKCINSVEDDRKYETPSPVKCIDTTPSSHPIRIMPRKVVIVPSTREPLPVILQAIREKKRLASRRKMIAELPKLFDRIYSLFQSVGLPELTKEELFQKLDIVDNTKEVEEQIKLLVELAPEWIYEKHDSLLCVNKIESPEAMRTRLSEAI